MSTTRAETVRRRIAAAGAAGLGVADYVATVLDLLDEAVPYDAVCLASTDPATGLMTGAHKVGLADARDREFARFEYEVDDVNHYRDLVRRVDPVGVLESDTEGRPETSPRFRDFLVPHFGIGHEMRAAFRADGEAWGMVGLFRATGSSGFSPAEADFVAGLSEPVARGLRAALVTARADRAGTSDHGPAVLVVGPDGDLRSATPSAQARLTDMWLGVGTTTSLPTPVLALAAAARAFRDGRLHAAPRARVRGADGAWWVLHAAPLSGCGDVVVTVEPARPPDVVPLVVAALGLTDRERDVVGMVLGGAPTAEIGRALHLSPYTVQDHLKSIFAKAGVRSRQQLTAKVFFEQYAPRMGAELGPSGWFAG